MSGKAFSDWFKIFMEKDTAMQFKDHPDIIKIYKSDSNMFKKLRNRKRSEYDFYSNSEYMKILVSVVADTIKSIKEKCAKKFNQEHIEIKLFSIGPSGLPLSSRVSSKIKSNVCHITESFPTIWHRPALLPNVFLKEENHTSEKVILCIGIDSIVKSGFSVNYAFSQLKQSIRSLESLKRNTAKSGIFKYFVISPLFKPSQMDPYCVLSPEMNDIIYYPLFNLDRVDKEFNIPFKLTERYKKYTLSINDWNKKIREYNNKSSDNPLDIFQYMTSSQSHNKNNNSSQPINNIHLIKLHLHLQDLYFQDFIRFNLLYSPIIRTNEVECVHAASALDPALSSVPFNNSSFVPIKSQLVDGDKLKDKQIISDFQIKKQNGESNFKIFLKNSFDEFKMQKKFFKHLPQYLKIYLGNKEENRETKTDLNLLDEFLQSLDTDTDGGFKIFPILKIFEENDRKQSTILSNSDSNLESFYIIRLLETIFKIFLSLRPWEIQINQVKNYFLDNYCPFAKTIISHFKRYIENRENRNYLGDSEDGVNRDNLRISENSKDEDDSSVFKNFIIPIELLINKTMNYFIQTYDSYWANVFDDSSYSVQSFKTILSKCLLEQYSINTWVIFERHDLITLLCNNYLEKLQKINYQNYSKVILFCLGVQSIPITYLMQEKISRNLEVDTVMLRDSYWENHLFSEEVDIDYDTKIKKENLLYLMVCPVLKSKISISYSLKKMQEHKWLHENNPIYILTIYDYLPGESIFSDVNEYLKDNSIRTISFLEGDFSKLKNNHIEKDWIPNSIHSDQVLNLEKDHSIHNEDIWKKLVNDFKDVQKKIKTINNTHSP